jgi:preprotein translocase subunit SecA
MIDLVLRKIFGSKHERDVKRMRPQVAAINALEAEVGSWPDEAFRRRADEVRQQIQDGTELDEILPEVFAMVREVGRRRLGMRHFDVQLMGGMVLHEGKIAEMATGEGKTLVATLPAVLNGLTGRGVHIVTVND